MAVPARSQTVTATVPAGTNPFAVAVNPVTNKIYVANFTSFNVTVIDGTTNTATTVAAGTSPDAVAVNPVTNKIYVANQSSNNVTVIDGTTNTTTTVAAGPSPSVVTVNPVTNKIYVANFNSNNVTVIDGATNSTTTVAARTSPNAVAVNPTTDKIYVANLDVATVTVIDGTTNAVTNVATGTNPEALIVAPTSNRVYLTNQFTNNITVIDEQQVQAIPLTTTIAPIPGGVTDNPIPEFTFSAASTFAPHAPAVQNVYFQIDTWQGPWIAPTASGANFTGSPSALLLPGTHIFYAFATDGQDANSTGVAQELIGNIAAEVFTVDPEPTNTALSVDSNPQIIGQPVTFTATVSDASGTPAGTVTFFDGATQLGVTVALSAATATSATATLQTSALAPGSHSLSASYNGARRPASPYSSAP